MTLSGDIQELTELGLSENEARVYLALVELGPSTTGPIIKRSGLYRVIVYDTLEKLIEVGLASYVVRRNRKLFSGEPPSRLLEMAEEKVSTAKKLSDTLAKKYIEKPLDKGAYVYEGWQGIKSAQQRYYELMEDGEPSEYRMMGASAQLHQRLDNFFNEFHEKRSSMKIPARLLFNESNRTFGALKECYTPVRIRYLPIVTPSWVSMYGDMLLIGLAEPEEPTAFVVKNRGIVASYETYFDTMWEQGVE